MFACPHVAINGNFQDVDLMAAFGCEAGIVGADGPQRGIYP